MYVDKINIYMYILDSQFKCTVVLINYKCKKPNKIDTGT